VVETEAPFFLQWAASRGVSLVGMEATATASLFEASLPEKIALVFGNEGSGISQSVRRALGTSVAIPIPGKAESLNVAAAAAVALYEVVRRRTLTGLPGGSIP